MGMKKNVRWIVDVAMTVLLLVLMARQLIGDRAHEWLGPACSCCGSFTIC